MCATFLLSGRLQNLQIYLAKIFRKIHSCEHGQPPRHPKGALRWTNISVDTIQALVRVELFEGSRRLFVSDAGMAAVVNDLRARTRCGPPTSFDLRSTVVRTGPARVPLNLDSTCSAASASKRLPDVGSKKRVRLHIPEAITKYVFTVSTSTAGDASATRAVHLEQGRTDTGKLRFVGIDAEG